MPFNNFKTFDDLRIGKKSLIAHVTLLTFSVMDHFKCMVWFLKTTTNCLRKTQKRNNRA